MSELRKKWNGIERNEVGWGAIIIFYWFNRAARWLLLLVAMTCCCGTSPADALPQFSNLRVLKSGWKEWRHLIDNLIPESETGRKGSDGSSSVTSLLRHLYAAKKSAKTIHGNSPIRIRINPEFLTSSTTTTTTTTTTAPPKKFKSDLKGRHQSNLSKLPNSPIYYVHLPSRYYIAGRAVTRKDQVDRNDALASPIYVATTVRPGYIHNIYLGLSLNTIPKFSSENCTTWIQTRSHDAVQMSYTIEGN